LLAFALEAMRLNQNHTPSPSQCGDFAQMPWQRSLLDRYRPPATIYLFPGFHPDEDAARPRFAPAAMA
jgi:hypothetical protein